jgi:hypothetical protein
MSGLEWLCSDQGAFTSRWMLLCQLRRAGLVSKLLQTLNLLLVGSAAVRRGAETRALKRFGAKNRPIPRTHIHERDLQPNPQVLFFIGHKPMNHWHPGHGFGWQSIAFRFQHAQ